MRREVGGHHGDMTVNLCASAREDLNSDSFKCSNCGEEICAFCRTEHTPHGGVCDDCDAKAASHQCTRRDCSCPACGSRMYRNSESDEHACRDTWCVNGSQERLATVLREAGRCYSSRSGRVHVKSSCRCPR